MSDDRLYDLLSNGDSIPWIKRAEHFVMLKVASGGVLPGELDEYVELVKHAGEVQAGPDKGEIADAMRKGIINAARSNTASDITQARKTERTRGARVGKESGTALGALAGLLVARKHGVGGAALGAGLGGVAGRGAGKIVGEEIDRARINSSLKKGEMEKATGFGDDDTPKLGAAEPQKEKADKKYPIIGGAVGAAGGAAANTLYAKHQQAKSVEELPKKMTQAAVVKHLGGERKAKKLGDKNLAAIVKQHMKSPKMKKLISAAITEHKKSFPSKGALALSGGALGLAGGVLGGAAVDKIRRKLKEKRAAAPVIGMPGGGPGPDEAVAAKMQAQEPNQPPPEAGAEGGAGSPLASFLDVQQQANESEFFRQMAEQAKSEADMAKQEAESAHQQLGMMQQQTQQQQMTTQQETAMAQQTAQQASQDAMMARSESMQAQQSQIALRAAVTNYRQALMDLLAQDPTQQVPPPMPPQGPMPPGPGAAPMGPPPGAPPPGAEAGAPGAPPMGGPPPGEPPGPPMGGPPEMGPPMPPPISGGPPTGGPPNAGPPAPTGPAPAKPAAPKAKE